MKSLIITVTALLLISFITVADEPGTTYPADYSQEALVDINCSIGEALDETSLDPGPADYNVTARLRVAHNSGSQDYDNEWIRGNIGGNYECGQIIIDEESLRTGGPDDVISLLAILT